MDKSHVLGIDIGTETIKVFSGTVSKESKPAIDSIGIIPAEGFDKGVVSDIKALAKTIRQAVDCVNLDNDTPVLRSYIGIGGMGMRSFRCRGSVAPLSGNGITNEDIDRVCRAAVLAGIPEELYVLHVIPLYYSIDKQKQISPPINQQGACLEVEAHVVTVPSRTLSELTNAIESEGVKVAGVTSNSIVEAQLFLEDNLKSNRMIIDIGAGNTDLALFSDGCIYHSASLPLGGNYITRDIMQALNISQPHAEGIKRYYSRLDQSIEGQGVMLDCNDYGTTDKQVSYDFLRDVIESRVEEIAFLIHEYVKEIIAEYPLDDIILTGGCSALPSINLQLEKRFEVAVRNKNPEQIMAEYCYPSNMSCYGVMCYAAQNIQIFEEVPEQTSLRSLFNKVKKFF